MFLTSIYSMLPEKVKMALGLLAAPVLWPMFIMWVGEGMLDYEMTFMKENVLPYSEMYLNFWLEGFVNIFLVTEKILYS